MRRAKYGWASTKREDAMERNLSLGLALHDLFIGGQGTPSAADFLVSLALPCDPAHPTAFRISLFRADRDDADKVCPNRCSVGSSLLLYLT